MLENDIFVEGLDIRENCWRRSLGYTQVPCNQRKTEEKRTKRAENKEKSAKIDKMCLKIGKILSGYKIKKRH